MVKTPPFRYRVGLNEEAVTADSRAREMRTPGATGLYLYTDLRFARAALRPGECIGVFSIPPDASFIEYNRNRFIARTDKVMLREVVDF